MKLEEAKMEFIQTWGTLGTSWGIPKSMAQVHAFLLSSHEALSTEEVMEGIQLSRGNVNINLRELMHWQLVDKQHKLGERKDFFIAKHDIWTVAKHVTEERKKREIEPVQRLLLRLRSAELEGDSTEIEHFQKLLKDLDDFVSQLSQLADVLVRIQDNKLFKRMIKLLV